MLDKSMCPIDWTKTAQQVHNHVRGLHPWPVATMELQGKTFKVHATRVVEGSGKTTLAYRLKERFGEDEVRLISHDSTTSATMNCPLQSAAS